MDSSIRAEFLNLLKMQLKAFSEYRVIQKQIQAALERLDSKKINDCEKEQKILDLRIKDIRTELVPYLKIWKGTDKKYRTELLDGEFGSVLEEIEHVAMEINKFHDENYGKKIKTDEKHHSQGESISSIINLYR